MKLGDIIALAKQGYKPGDIKELINMAEPEDIQPELTETVEAVTEFEEQLPEEVVKEVKPEIDYKVLYEKSQADLKAAQQANVRQTISQNNKSDEDVLKDIVRAMY